MQQNANAAATFRTQAGGQCPFASCLTWLTIFRDPNTALKYANAVLKYSRATLNYLRLAFGLSNTALRYPKVALKYPRTALKDSGAVLKYSNAASRYFYSIRRYSNIALGNPIARSPPATLRTSNTSDRALIFEMICFQSGLP